MESRALPVASDVVPPELGEHFARSCAEPRRRDDGGRTRQSHRLGCPRIEISSNPHSHFPGDFVWRGESECPAFRGARGDVDLPQTRQACCDGCNGIVDHSPCCLRNWFAWHEQVANLDKSDELLARAVGQIRYEMDVDDRAVTLLECRPPWRDGFGSEWTRFPFARLRYTKVRREWQIYWRDQNLNFHAYDLVPPSDNVDKLLAEIDSDPTAIFFG